LDPVRAFQKFWNHSGAELLPFSKGLHAQQIGVVMKKGFDDDVCHDDTNLAHLSERN